MKTQRILEKLKITRSTPREKLYKEVGALELRFHVLEMQMAAMSQQLGKVVMNSITSQWIPQLTEHYKIVVNAVTRLKSIEEEKPVGFIEGIKKFGERKQVRKKQADEKKAAKENLIKTIQEFNQFVEQKWNKHLHGDGVKDGIFPGVDNLNEEARRHWNCANFIEKLSSNEDADPEMAIDSYQNKLAALRIEIEAVVISKKTQAIHNIEDTLRDAIKDLSSINAKLEAIEVPPGDEEIHEIIVELSKLDDALRTKKDERDKVDNYANIALKIEELEGERAVLQQKTPGMITTKINEEIASLKQGIPQLAEIDNLKWGIRLKTLELNKLKKEKRNQDEYKLNEVTKSSVEQNKQELIQLLKNEQESMEKTKDFANNVVPELLESIDKANVAVKKIELEQDVREISPELITEWRESKQIESELQKAKNELSPLVMKARELIIKNYQDIQDEDALELWNKVGTQMERSRSRSPSISTVREPVDEKENSVSSKGGSKVIMHERGDSVDLRRQSVDSTSSMHSIYSVVKLHGLSPIQETETDDEKHQKKTSPPSPSKNSRGV